MLKRLCLIALLVLLSVPSWAARPAKPPAQPAWPGLQVRPDGVLLMAGKPYSGIGVNYVSAFARVLANPADTTYEQGFKTLSQYKIPFVRVWIMGYWPSENKLYMTDKQAFFKRLDGVVKCAEQNNVGLIPSFFFNLSTVPDLVEEPVSEWGNPGSKTNAFMRQFVSEVVRRYKGFNCMWAWEFGNEMNLAADLPNAKDFRPPVVPALGTATSRSEKDEITHDTFRTAASLFAKEIRKYDQRRPIITGNTFPRSSAWHQKKAHSWGTDTEDQFAEMLIGDSPDPIDTLSGHFYPGEADRFGRKLTYEEHLALSMKVSARAKKPLVIGEFGASDKPDPEQARKDFTAMLEAFKKTKVPLAALWVYDFSSQDNDWNVTAANSRSYMLKAISEANREAR